MAQTPSAPDADREAQGPAAGVTGYYRSEDADLDLPRPTVKSGCAVLTPATTNHLYGQTICIMDGTIAQARRTRRSRRSALRLRWHQPGHQHARQHRLPAGLGNAILHEDAETTFEFPHNNDLWDCPPDGPDQDLIRRVRSRRNPERPHRGGDRRHFDATGTRFFVSVQHNISGSGDLEIDGWK